MSANFWNRFKMPLSASGDSVFGSESNIKDVSLLSIEEITSSMEE